MWENVKEDLYNRESAKECTKFISVQYILFSQNLTSEPQNRGRNKGHKCPHCTRMRRLQVYFLVSMTLHSPMLQQHRGIGFRMCCRHATDKKLLQPVFCLVFKGSNLKQKAIFFQSTEILSDKENEIGHTRECFITDQKRLIPPENQIQD